MAQRAKHTNDLIVQADICGEDLTELLDDLSMAFDMAGIFSQIECTSWPPSHCAMLWNMLSRHR